MTKIRIPDRLRRHVEAEFRGRCAYCHTLTSITGTRVVMDHIIPIAAGGQTMEDNLCAGCHACNEFKGAQTKARDPVTRRRVVLFHPRKQNWRDHFFWSRDATQVIGLTATGRATVTALNINRPDIVEARRRWAAVGWHPPEEDLP